MELVTSGQVDGTTVRKLEEFPELLEALRDGDLLAVRSVCARLFDIDAREDRMLVKDSIPSRSTR